MVYSLISLKIMLTFMAAVAIVVAQNKVSKTSEWTDWRLTNTISDVIDQGTCQAGWAIASTTLYEWQVSRQRQSEGNYSGYIDLSDGYILDCSSQGGCGNGSLYGALKYLIANGSPLQSDYSNNDIYSGTQNTTNCSNSTLVKTSWAVYLHSYRTISTGKLKKLVEAGPTANQIATDSEFNSYTGSPSPYKCKHKIKHDLDLNHAVVVVGYDKHTHFIIKNSKGTSWGQNGYMTIKKNHDCGLRRRVFQISIDQLSNSNSITGGFHVAVPFFIIASALLLL